MTRINKALDPASAQGEYIGLTLIEPAAADGAGRRAAGDVRARPAALLRGRLPGVRRPRRACRRRADRRGRLGGGRRPPRPRARAGDRLPLLTRMIGAPLHVDIGPGTVAQLAPLLADRRISSGGHVAVVVGPGLGEEIAETLRPGLGNAAFWTLDGGGVAEANALAKRLRGRVLRRARGHRRRQDARRLQARLHALRAPDGRGRDEPRARRHRLAGRVAGGGGPQGLLRRPDADRPRRRPRLRAPLRGADAALGDRRRDLQPRRDRGLAARRRRAARAGRRARGDVRPDRREGDPAPQRTGSTTPTSSSRSPRRSCSAASRWRPPGRAARAAAATTRSCTRSTTSSPAPRATASSPAPARCSRRTCAATRRWPRAIDACLTRHGLPRLPADLGLTEAQFAEAVVRRAGHAPGPLHDPRAPGARPHGGQRACPRVRRRLRSLS